MPLFCHIRVKSCIQRPQLTLQHEASQHPPPPRQKSRTNSSVWRDYGITGKPANKSRQPLWLTESEWTPQHLPPSSVQGLCNPSAWPKTTPPATDFFLPWLSLLSPPWSQANLNKFLRDNLNRSPRPPNYSTFALQSFSSDSAGLPVHPRGLKDSRGSHRQGYGASLKEICSALLYPTRWDTIFVLLLTYQHLAEN